MADVFENSPELALEWHRAGKGAVLATVVETWGSAPRGVGSQMVVSGEGEMEGSVSGGCVEGAVVVEAMDMVGSDTGKMLEFGVSDDEAFAVGLACGGRIKVWVEPVGPGLPEDMLSELVDARAARRAVAYEVNTESGDRAVRDAGEAMTGVEGDLFTHVFAPPIRVLVVGAVHIAQALVPMARLAGYDPVLIDPRGAFGAEARFPGERIVEDWPDDALAALGLDAKTAVVTLTHDPKLDDPAIMAALRSEVFYLGCLGSTRTHAKRVARLTEAGFSEEEIGRIHAPVGLDIGSKGPGEIAVSILAQIVERLRKG
jgi:xanthine dehydrogenase accessory factor